VNLLKKSREVYENFHVKLAVLISSAQNQRITNYIADNKGRNQQSFVERQPD
jgi:hypothetical protein